MALLFMPIVYVILASFPVPTKVNTCYILAYSLFEISAVSQFGG